MPEIISQDTATVYQAADTFIGGEKCENTK
jgi:hypothetical protein